MTSQFTEKYRDDLYKKEKVLKLNPNQRNKTTKYHG